MFQDFIQVSGQCFQLLIGNELHVEFLTNRMKSKFVNSTNKTVNSTGISS
jgi:hypothetical protein